MKAVEMPIEKLVPYINNPRINDDSVPMVKESIKLFGFQQPVVVDKNNVIVIGHTRTMAAKELGMKTVPVIVADDLDEEKIRALRLIDNKVAENAEWDEELLNEEIGELLDSGFVDIQDFFGEKVADAFMEEIEQNDDSDGSYECTCPRCKFSGEEYLFMRYQDTGEGIFDEEDEEDDE